MKALRTLRRSLYSLAPWVVFCAFLSAQQHSYQEDSSFLFDNSHYGLEGEAKVTWDEKYRAGAEQVVFREEGSKGKEDERQRKAIVKALLEAAMDEDEDEEEEGKWVGLVKEEDQ